MPVYKCPKCGRKVEKPEGTYYCSKCGQDVVMVQEVSPKEKYAALEKKLEEKLEYVAAVVEARDRIIRAVAGVQYDLGISDRDIEKILSEVSKFWTIFKREMI